MKIRKGKGVMSKDGVTPWAPRTLHYTEGNWSCPADYTMNNMALLIAALCEGKISSIKLIDENNIQRVYELTAKEKRARGLK